MSWFTCKGLKKKVYERDKLSAVSHFLTSFPHMINGPKIDIAVFKTAQNRPPNCDFFRLTKKITFGRIFYRRFQENHFGSVRTIKFVCYCENLVIPILIIARFDSSKVWVIHLFFYKQNE